MKEGLINKNSLYRIMRGDAVAFDHMRLAGLRSFKKEVNEVKSGNECGLSFVETYAIQKGDVLESYSVKKAED